MMNKLSGYTATTTPFPETSEIEIRGEIDADSFSAYEPRVLSRLQKTTALPGFRKGHVPEAVLRDRIGDQTILHEMAGCALDEVYPTIIADHALDPVGTPSVQITKLARSNPLGFTIRVGVVPSLTLPDYRALAKSIPREEISAEDSEVDTALEEIRNRMATNKPRTTSDTPADLPPLDDAFALRVAGVGTLEELRQKIREEITAEKTTRAKSTHRAKIVDAILSKISIPLPPALVVAQTNTLFAEMRHDVERMGIVFQDYLNHLKKDEATLRAELTPSAEKRARMELVLGAIATKESLTINQGIIDAEVERIHRAHPDTDHARVTAYVAQQLMNEKIFALLEEPAQSGIL
ncbi:MAG: trigger factor [Minisyncoccota bacterium]